MDRGADVNAKTGEGYTALHCAVDVDGETCRGETPGIIIQMLVDAGSDLEAKQHWGWTPLMRAVLEGTEEEVQALCDAGARVDHIYPDHTLPECKRGDTMLMAAVYDPEKVRILMAAGADPYQRGLYGQNAIAYASDQLYEISEPEHRAEFENWSARRKRDQETFLRNSGVPDETIRELLDVPKKDYVLELETSLRILNRMSD